MATSISMGIEELSEKLKNVKIEGKVTITSVERFDRLKSDELLLFGLKPDIVNRLESYADVPFYRVLAKVSATRDSSFDVLISLPEDGWNGRLCGCGNGGGAAFLMPATDFAPLAKKYAVMHLSLGTAPDIDRGVNTPAVWADFGWRATHLATVLAKQVIELAYGEKPKYSYFLGVSTGGEQGISSAEFFPDDYDGIIAGLPGISRTYLHLYFLHVNKYFMVDDYTPAFTYKELLNITRIVRTVFEKYGDGVPGDSFISNPHQLNDAQKAEVFEEIIKNANLSDDQVFRLGKIYEGPLNPVTGERIFPGLPMGSESSLPNICPLDTEMQPLQVPIEEAFKDVLFYPMEWALGEPNAEFFKKWRNFDFDKDTDRMAALAKEVNADTADLSEFKAKGGKLLMTGGACDSCVVPANVTDYYDRAVEKMGGLEATQDFFRYFVIPGYGHGTAGLPFEPEGMIYICADTVDVPDLLLCARTFALMGLIDVIVDWVEKDVAPERLLAIGWNKLHIMSYADPDSGIKHRRPIYAYPDKAEYIGGDPNNMESFRRKKGEVGMGTRRAKRYY